MYIKLVLQHTRDNSNSRPTVRTNNQTYLSLSLLRLGMASGWHCLMWSYVLDFQGNRSRVHCTQGWICWWWACYAPWREIAVSVYLSIQSKEDCDNRRTAPLLYRPPSCGTTWWRSYWVCRYIASSTGPDIREWLADSLSLPPRWAAALGRIPGLREAERCSEFSYSSRMIAPAPCNLHALISP